MHITGKTKVYKSDSSIEKVNSPAGSHWTEPVQCNSNQSLALGSVFSTVTVSYFAFFLNRHLKNGVECKPRLRANAMNNEDVDRKRPLSRFLEKVKTAELQQNNEKYLIQNHNKVF